MATALSGLKVIELGDFISAAFCAKMMADLGAEVVKVEPPEGDSARRHGPFPEDVPHPERSALFLNLNTNKLGVTLDVNSPSGKKIFLQLVEHADVVVENFPPRSMRDLGLDYDYLRAKNRALVLTSVTPFGQTGPYRDYKGYAINAAALGGVSTIVGEPQREPLAPPLSLGHYQSGAMAAIATLAAFASREVTGEGQHVDVSEAECWATIHIGHHINDYVNYGREWTRHGHRTPRIYPFTMLPCKDGFISLVAVQGFQWKRFLEIIGDGEVPDWYASDPRFRDRVEIAQFHADEMDARLAPWLGTHTKEEIFAACRERHIPFAPVRGFDEVANDEHLDQRHFFVQADHPEAGRLTYPGAPYRLSETPWQLGRPAPTLGQHNEEIYCRRLGLSREDLAMLRQAGTI